MIVNLITNWTAKKGLMRDATLVAALLHAWGHATRAIQFTEVKQRADADLNVFLETVVPPCFAWAPRNWWIPNPEWASPESLTHLPAFELVWCKTREAHRLFGPLSEAARYVGFESEDRYDPTIERTHEVLHVAGNNILKGTESVVEAWAQNHGTLPPLTIVGDVLAPRAISGVTFLRDLPDEELRRLQNRCWIHLCPSEAEGWGHTIHEGLSVGARVIVTDAPPMSESRGAEPCLPARPFARRYLATLYQVRPGHIAEAVRDTRSRLEAGDGECDLTVRAMWEDARTAFRARLQEMLA